MAIVTIKRANITEEERLKRLKQIKEAAVKLVIAAERRKEREK